MRRSAMFPLALTCLSACAADPDSAGTTDAASGGTLGSVGGASGGSVGGDTGPMGGTAGGAVGGSGGGTGGVSAGGSGGSGAPGGAADAGTPGPFDAEARPDQRVSPADAGAPADLGIPTDLPLAGAYLVAFSTFLRPDRPLLAEATIEGPDDALGMSLRFLRCTLLRDDVMDCPRTRLEGDPIGPFPVLAGDDDTFFVDLGALTLPGAANPITGRNISLEVSMTGRRLVTGNLCGDLSGQITAPIVAPLTPDLDHFGAVRLAEGQAPEDYPGALLLGCPE